MQRRKFIKAGSMAAAVGAGAAITSCSKSDSASLLGKTQIQHGVIFSLKHAKGSPEEKKFLEDGRKILTGIPVVQHFQVFTQVSTKNDYDYGFTMVFDSMEDYETYNNHPDHVSFVKDRWEKEVSKFLEIDFEVWPSPA